MNRIPSTEYIESIRKRCPAGTRVELLHMDDPYTRLKPGDRGSVLYVDDIASVHIAWDNGSSLACVFGVDSFRVLPPA